MQNGDTGFDDVKRDGGMANGRDADNGSTFQWKA